MLRIPNSRCQGISLGNGLLFGLIALVMVLGGVALYRSLAVQRQVATTFQGWYEDYSGYQKAMADQKITQRPVLVFFYATWCPHCKHFTAKVLSDPSMQTFVKQYPHVRIAPDNGAAEKQLMVDFGAQGYPAFYVVTPDQQRKQIETFVNGPEPRLKSPAEFMASIQEATGQKSP